MKKKVIAIIAIVCLVGSLCGLLYNTFLIRVFRYDTPEEAFKRNNPHHYELVDKVEDKDAAVFVYKKNESSFSSCTVVKDSRGWSAPVEFMNGFFGGRAKKIPTGFAYVKEFKGKYILETNSMISSDEEFPTISDSLDSEFIFKAYSLGNSKLQCGFLIRDEAFPEDYVIKVNGEEIALE